MSKVLYAAGPITGLTYRQAAEWRSEDSLFVQRAQVLGWSVLSPMRDKDQFSLGDKPLTPYFDEGEKAVERDLLDIRESSVVVLNLLGVEQVSLGCMAELGFAFALGKRIIAVLDAGNPHGHVFVDYMATTIVESLEGALVEITAQAIPYA